MLDGIYTYMQKAAILYHMLLLLCKIIFNCNRTHHNIVKIAQELICMYFYSAQILSWQESNDTKNTNIAGESYVATYYY